MHQSKIIVYRNGQPCQYREVSFYFMNGNGHTNHFSTNRDEVAFVSHASSGKAIIYVDGMERGRFQAPGQEIIYL